MEFTQKDFEALELKYPEGYWYLHSLALTRENAGLRQELARIKELEKK